VRHTVRPFIKEFRPVRLSRRNSSTAIGDADNDGSKPSFLDLNVFTTRQNKFDDEHKVALTAADAVFGEGSPAAPLQGVSVIQRPCWPGVASLIRDDDVLTVRLTEGDGKSRGSRSVGKSKALPHSSQKANSPARSESRGFF